ncbi:MULTISPECIES: TlrC/CarA/OleB/SrmB family ABC-F type ribosomal protection protein [Streptomyces]|uniref:TlrC/CarA/OleB/SrmB family ABC-F type ribosomal protection protein n=1 Tax=Streptomyces tsukubensis (strain DSM 42081 / NBRC 108919 / NRRL 18488 / 9993) TaxID=1114943 RepID=A0A7G3UF68_STRT9|nr:MULTISPECIES: TlrC/CarA/OleB/SrmB family ABC-F type ribosomal protection protein [Streptomyces]MYS66962.1 TlrC/CarA/OleB/SrmB family ABC-F type ribosomal protection protein [Streptomyces sp. SID5473]QKM69053.1 TlrC/CarA/OleB/SrmB family ABC-F type ribosomal protection protein [Streptomyces tsukubensis NRRL18488]TAI40725.1 TlrC/CarA/OleB/SrmB family ABC-F type ribosomal protection protein [Streptomyces tsukubensis]
MRTRTAQLAVHDLTKRYDEKLVLDHVHLSVRPGEKVGVIGDNGSGKSTLLKLLTGHERPDSGEVTVSAPGGVGYLAQALDLPADATVQDAIDLALTELRALEAQLRCDAERLETAGEGPALESALTAYERHLALYEARDGYRAEDRVDIALYGLGLPGLARDRLLGSLSGGERSRLALAATLAARPELLLLDEPTNDLDDQAVGWLEAHLREHRGTVVAVTHDRAFLANLTSTILEVAAGRITRYGDGYAGYRTAKAAERSRRLQEYQHWRDELTRSRHLAESNGARLGAIPHKVPMAKFGHGAFRARDRSHGAMARIRNAKERVARLTAAPVQLPSDPLVFAASVPTGTANGEAAAELVDVHLDNRLDLPQLSLAPGERLLVTGPNGAGKSTLLGILAGEVRPQRGTVRVSGKVGILRQQQVPWPSDLSVLGAFAHDRPGDREEQRDLLLSLGLFRPADLRLRIGELSYGQRRRIELARLVTRPVDLLLLDEPTNHLSPALVEELEQALMSYEGALVVVTHDRLMRERFTGSRLELAGGRPVVSV